MHFEPASDHAFFIALCIIFMLVSLSSSMLFSLVSLSYGVFGAVSTLGWHLACADEDPCSYQPKDEDSSGDHKGEMHAR
jgi:hypothetical protein